MSREIRRRVTCVITACLNRTHGFGGLRRCGRCAGGVGAANYGDGGSIEDLYRISARFEALVTEATAAFEAREEWAADGAKTAAAWIATRCRVPRRAASAGCAWGAPAPPARVREAWREGRIGTDQAQAIAPARRHRTEAAMVRDEAMLVSYAAEMGFEDFCRALSYWKQLADPDGAEDADEARMASRNVFLESSFSGMWLGQMTLDPISGSSWPASSTGSSASCSRPTVPRPGSAWDARRIDELARTPRQRRADALVEMATRSRTAPADGIRPAPLFSVFVGYETLYGNLPARERHRPRPFGSGSVDGLGLLRAGPLQLGHRVDVSVRARLFTGGTRGRSSSATGCARTRIATSRPRTARPTTSSPTPRAG